ncbi:hypothetical protein ACFYRL_17650 [Streptomyces goshikiensis]|uniref:hypothetical protein n=1 Tax=Streptomyces goshikiensis TaxID=1942 RepID=UPI0036C71217
MIRIVTASTYAALLADRADLAQARTAVDALTDARDRALTDLSQTRKAAADQVGTVESLRVQLSEAREAAAAAARQVTAAEEGTVALVKQVTRERDTAREEAGALDEVRQDLIRLRAHAANPEDGGPVRGAIAYGILRDLIGRARQERAEAGQDGGLPRPFDVIAMVLGFDTAEADEDAAAPVREEAAPAASR